MCTACACASARERGFVRPFPCNLHWPGRARPAAQMGLPSHSGSQTVPSKLSLPFELLDDIFGYLYEGGHDATLRACAEACRAFARIVRPYAFHAVRIESQAAWRNLTAIFEAEPLNASYVRILTIADPRKQLFCLTREVGVALQALTSLSHVGLESVSITSFILDELRPHLPVLHALHLNHVEFQDLSDFVQCLCSCTSLRDLSVQNLDWNQPQRDQGELCLSLPLLDTLTVDSVLLEELVGFGMVNMAMAPTSIQLSSGNARCRVGGGKLMERMASISGKLEALTISMDLNGRLPRRSRFSLYQPCANASSSHWSPRPSGGLAQNPANANIHQLRCSCREHRPRAAGTLAALATGTDWDDPAGHTVQGFFGLECSVFPGAKARLRISDLCPAAGTCL
jgi:hypothetical protein